MQMPKKSLVNRNNVFRYFLTATSVSLLGSSIFDLAIPVYVINTTHDVISLSLTNVALNLPFFLMAPLTGHVVDNFNKRRVMLASDIGQVVCLTFLLIYLWMGYTTLWPILFTVFLAKTLMILFETVATFQLIPALVDSRDLSEANTWFLSLQRVIQIVGPLFAGILLATSGVRGCVLINTISFGATLFFVLRMKNLNDLIKKNGGFEENPSLSPTAIKNNFLESVKYIWKSPLFKPFIFMMFLWNLSPLLPNTPSMTYYYTQTHHFSEAEYGMVASFFGLVGIIGFLGAGYFYKKYDFSPTFSFSGIWLAGFAGLSVLCINHPILLAAVFGLGRMGGSVLSMGTFFLRQTNVPKSKMGGVNACLRMFFMSSMPLSAFLQGYLINHFGVGATFVLGAFAIFGTSYYASQTAIAYAKLHRRPIPKVA